MTLDEAIQHVEEVAEEEAKLCKRYDDASGYTRSLNEEIRTSYAKEYEKRSAKCRQFAEWLKDYKRLLDQEPCDAISRQAAKAKIKSICNKYRLAYEEGVNKIQGKSGSGYDFGHAFDDLPPVYPKQKTGRWITVAKGLIVTSYKCSECGRTVGDDTGYDVTKDYPYCHCGAKMQEIEE